MGQSLLKLIQTACDEMGLTRPTAVVSAADTQTRQLYALLLRTGAEIQRRGYWMPLQTEFLIQLTTPWIATANVTEGSALIAGVAASGILTAGLFSVSGTGISSTARIQAIYDNGDVLMTEPATTTTVDGITITFTQDTFYLPADWGQYTESTAWDRGQTWPMIGPLSPQEDQAFRSGRWLQGPRRMFRYVGNTLPAIAIRPPPTTDDANETLVLEYVSKYWVRDGSSNVAKATFEADNDTSAFPDDLMVMGVKWRFRESKGFAYGDGKAEWEGLIDTAIAQMTPGRTLNLSRRSRSSMAASIPDGNWPSVPG